MEALFAILLNLLWTCFVGYAAADYLCSKWTKSEAQKNHAKDNLVEIGSRHLYRGGDASGHDDTTLCSCKPKLHYIERESGRRVWAHNDLPKVEA